MRAPRITAFLLCLLITLVCHAQQRTDQAEYGYKGPVKKVVTYHYDSSALYPGKDMVHDRNDWFMHAAYYFNQKGNFDSLVYHLKNRFITDTIICYRLVYITQGDDRHALRTDGNGKIIDSLRYKQTSDSSYHVTETGTNGHRKARVETYLTSAYREKSGSYLIYEYDSLEAGETYQNTLDANNLLIKGERTDIITGRKTITIFRYANTDIHGNPHTIYHYEADGKTIRRIALREVEYY